MPYRHVPVMREEIISFLNCKPGGCYVDCTVGGAGHAKAILEKIVPGGLLIGIDQDPDAIANARAVLSSHGADVRLFHENFIRLPDILSHLRIEQVDGLIADLGLSLYQIENSGRGFSFLRDEPLDMRMNAGSGVTAQSILNTASESHLTHLFKEYGEERWAVQIARKIVSVRQSQPILTTQALVDVVCDAIPGPALWRRKKHPGTKIFMALRIHVNQELEVLDGFLDVALAALKPGGRMGILTFHSLEDRMVKQRFRSWEGRCVCPPDFPQCVCHRRQQAVVLTRKAIRPSPAEVAVNPMSRSANLRVVEKC